MPRTRLLFVAAILAALPSLFAAPAASAIEPSKAKVVTVPGDKPFDFGSEPVRYIENDRVKLGLNLALGGAVTYLEDKANQYYSGPRPFIGPNGEKPSEDWAALGWNPIQSGDCAGYRSQVLDFERPDGKTIFLRTRPMLWPHSGLPAECLFECKYTLVDNGFTLEATIVNNRSDKTFYGVCDQETPAMYVNAPWYKLVTYLGDKPYSNGPVAVLVDKGDGRGWPCTSYYCPEHWSALVNEKNFGIGVYQPTSTVRPDISRQSKIRFSTGISSGRTARPLSSARSKRFARPSMKSRKKRFRRVQAGFSNPTVRTGLTSTRPTPDSP